MTGPSPPLRLDVRLDPRSPRLAVSEPKSPTGAIRVSNWPGDSPADAADDPRPVAFKLAGRHVPARGLESPHGTGRRQRGDRRHELASLLDAGASFRNLPPEPPETFQKLLPRHSAESQATLAAAITWPERDVADQVIGAKFDTLPHPTEGLAEHVEAFANRPTIAAAPRRRTGDPVRPPEVA